MVMSGASTALYPARATRTTPHHPGGTSCSGRWPSSFGPRAVAVVLSGGRDGWHPRPRRHPRTGGVIPSPRTRDGLSTPACRTSAVGGRERRRGADAGGNRRRCWDGWWVTARTSTTISAPDLTGTAPAGRSISLAPLVRAAPQPATGIDFTQYKQNTIRAGGLPRRMALREFCGRGGSGSGRLAMTRAELARRCTATC